MSNRPRTIEPANLHVGDLYAFTMDDSVGRFTVGDTGLVIGPGRTGNWDCIKLLSSRGSLFEVTSWDVFYGMKCVIDNSVQEKLL